MPTGHAVCHKFADAHPNPRRDMTDAFIDELTAGWPDTAQLVRIVFRLCVAALLGGIVGAQRESQGKEAGLRTHMLVALGAALFVVAPIEFGMTSEELARIIQGLVAGIGFLGAGAILKVTRDKQIHGLTSAAGLWLTAAVGVAAGLGRWGSALVGVVLIWLILDVVARVELRLQKAAAPAAAPASPDATARDAERRS